MPKLQAAIDKLALNDLYYAINETSSDAERDKYSRELQRRRDNSQMRLNLVASVALSILALNALRDIFAWIFLIAVGR